jgi:N-acetylneuraminate synthase
MNTNLRIYDNESQSPNVTLTIEGREIGVGRPTYVIAELSANHGQQFETAVELVGAAKAAGANAVKLQTYTPETITLESDGAPFRIHHGTAWDGQTLFELYRSAYMPWEWQPRLMQIARGLGMHCFSSPFDATAVDFLEQIGVPAYKVASFELVDLPLLRKIGQTAKPVIASTGMASLPEIQSAVTALRDAGAASIALLKCTSAYPAPASAMNLVTIGDLASRFRIPVGLSDHTTGIAAPVCAVALGASIVEKHLTLDRSAGGPDSAFSLEPLEFKAMVDAIRVAEKSLGKVTYGGSEAEAGCQAFRRSLFVVRDICAGEVLTADHVRSIRPGDGLEPKHYDAVIGRRAASDLARGTPLQWKHVA